MAAMMALITDAKPLTPHANGNQLGAFFERERNPAGKGTPIRNPSGASKAVVVTTRTNKLSPSTAEKALVKIRG